MTSSSHGVPYHPPRNPFATRYTEPGVIPYLFPPGLDAETLINRLALLQWRGQIVAPHGRGKTTLLRTLLPLLEKRFAAVHLEILHDGERRVSPRCRQFLRNRDRDHLTIIDGYEQLGVFEAWRLRHGATHLLVTTHRRSSALPLLLHDPTTPERFIRLVRHLWPGNKAPGDERLHELFIKHQGNCRDAFFELYDIAAEMEPIDPRSNRNTI